MRLPFTKGDLIKLKVDGSYVSGGDGFVAVPHHLVKGLFVTVDGEYQKGRQRGNLINIGRGGAVYLVRLPMSKMKHWELVIGSSPAVSGNVHQSIDDLSLHNAYDVLHVLAGRKILLDDEAKSIEAVIRNLLTAKA